MFSWVRGNSQNFQEVSHCLLAGCTLPFPSSSIAKKSSGLQLRRSFSGRILFLSPIKQESQTGQENPRVPSTKLKRAVRKGAYSPCMLQLLPFLSWQAIKCSDAETPVHSKWMCRRAKSTCKSDHSSCISPSTKTLTALQLHHQITPAKSHYISWKHSTRSCRNC